MRTRLIRLSGTVLALALLSFSSFSVSAGATTGKKKALSLTNITIVNPQTGVGVPDWVTQGQGYYKAHGLNVTLINSPATTADLVAGLIGGGYSFININGGAQIIAANQGASIRAVLMAQTSTPQEFAISSTFAAAHNIPSAGNTQKQALAQFMSLKGSHIRIAYSNSGAEGYAWTLAMASRYGLTAGLSQPNDDINMSFLGAVSTLQAGLAANKIDAFSNTPPATVVPNSIELQLYRLTPLEKTSGVYLTTSTTMIQQHPDTVQAVVAAETQGMIYVLKHPVQAQKYAAAQYATLGITSPETAQYLFSSCYVPFDKNPYPDRSSFNTEVSLLNTAGSNIHLKWSTFVVPRFAAAANKLYGLSVPKG